MIVEVKELLEFIYRKTRGEEPNGFDKLLYQLGSEYLHLVSQKEEGDVDMKCDCCGNVATYYTKFEGHLSFRCEECTRNMHIGSHNHLHWAYIPKGFYGK